MAPHPDAQGRYTDKDMTIIIDAKSNHDWIVPRRVMCAFFWLGIILLFTGIILLVTSKHKGEVYKSWGAILLGLGFCLLLICLILCLHAYCVITITEEEPFAKRNVQPPPPSVVMNGRKPRHKGEERGISEERRELNSSNSACGKRAKPVQLLIVEKEDVDALQNGQPLCIQERGRPGLGSAAAANPVKGEGKMTDESPKGKQTATVSHPVLGDVHVSVRPANPVMGSPGRQIYDVEGAEMAANPVRLGPAPSDIPLHLLESLDELGSQKETGTASASLPSAAASVSSAHESAESSRNISPKETVIIPSKYATAFSVVKNSASEGSSKKQPEVANTYIGYQGGLEMNPFPIGHVVTTKPPPIPGRHNSHITAHVIPIPIHHYKNYPLGVLPPPPANLAAHAAADPNATSQTMSSQSVTLTEHAIKMQLVPNGERIEINMPENYIQRIPPSHDHEGRRFSQPVVVYLNPNQNMGLSQISVYDNVQYVWAEPPPPTTTTVEKIPN